MADLITITVAGKLSDPKFHRSRAIAEALYEKHPDQIASPCVMEFFETQWEQFLKKTANTYKGVFYEHESSPLIYLANNNEYIGDGEDFSMWALHNFNEKDSLRFTEYQQIALDASKAKVNGQQACRQYAKMTFKIGNDQTQGGCIEEAVIIELFKDICPKTVQNFLELCKGFKHEGNECGYKGSDVHRVVPGMYLQTGRVKGNEQGAASCFGTEFADESFCIKHTAAGMVGMCKRAGLKHSNETQFYITTGAPLDFLDGENVIFGRIVRGFSTIEKIESLAGPNERPAEPVVISACNEYSEN